MGKTSNRAAGIEPVKLAATNNPGPTADPAFSEGELGQLQEILFGQQTRNTSQQIDRLAEQCNEQIQTLSNVLNSRLNQLTDTLEQSNKAFDARLLEMQSENQQALDSIGTKMQASTAELSQEINSLSESSSSEQERLNTQLLQHQATLQGEIESTASALSAKLEQSVEGLESEKLNRQDFAKVLSDISKNLINQPSTQAQ